MREVLLFLLVVFYGGVVHGRPQEAANKLSATSAAPPPPPAPASHESKNVTIVKDTRVTNDGKGNYNYDIELSDGTKLIQMGGTIPPPAGGNDTEPILVIKGSYSYIDPQGKLVEVKYIADDKGFQVMQDSLPTSAVKESPAAPASPAPIAAVVHPEEAPLETQASSIASAPSAIA